MGIRDFFGNHKKPDEEKSASEIKEKGGLFAASVLLSEAKFSFEQFVSDLNLTAGFGIKDSRTTLRKIQEEVDQVTSGMLTATINVAAEYQFSRMVGLKFYYDQTINRPHIDNQYRNMNFETGIAVTQIVDPHPVNLNTFASEIVLPSYERMDEVAVLKVC